MPLATESLDEGHKLNGVCQLCFQMKSLLLQWESLERCRVTSARELKYSAQYSTVSGVLKIKLGQ